VTNERSVSENKYKRINCLKFKNSVGFNLMSKKSSSTLIIAEIGNETFIKSILHYIPVCKEVKTQQI